MNVTTRVGFCVTNKVHGTPIKYSDVIFLRQKKPQKKNYTSPEPKRANWRSNP
ncbi:hypothetical protein DK095_500005 [Flavobacterium psychrophilum]|nr:hypothetical protein DK095_500005 [Flavobacterium psychrophilum]SNB04203.1 hypothetical protein JIP1600_1060002 [Flavobacterium psychrophilum]